MTATIVYLRDTASASQIAEHLGRCDTEFVPPLSQRVDIDGYARKIEDKAVRFEAWSGGVLVGLLAMYANDPVSRMAYVTSVSVLSEWTGAGIATRLVGQCVAHARAAGALRVSLSVARGNLRAIALYERSGFAAATGEGPWITMVLGLEREG